MADIVHIPHLPESIFSKWLKWKAPSVGVQKLFNAGPRRKGHANRGKQAAPGNICAGVYVCV